MDAIESAEPDKTRVVDPNNSWRRSRQSTCKFENIASNSQPLQRIWEWHSIQNWDGPACQQHNKKLAASIPAETAAIHMRSLTIEATKTLVHSLVSSRVDYCNSILSTELRTLSYKEIFAHLHLKVYPQQSWGARSSFHSSYISLIIIIVEWYLCNQFKWLYVSLLPKTTQNQDRLSSSIMIWITNLYFTFWLHGFVTICLSIEKPLSTTHQTIQISPNF